MNLLSQTTGKCSRAEWIGILPSRWDEVRLKYGLRLITEKASEDTFKVALENIESWSGRYIATETAFEGEGTAFQKGDLLFGKLRPYLAKALLVDAPGQAVGDFHVLRPAAEVHGRFALYYVLSRDFIAVVDGSTYGAKMPRASWDFMSNLPLPLPPLSEQAAIVAFLDRETGKIDALVEEQRRLIDLLNEKRRAIISHAVTKGLDRSVKMRPSGIGWLGDVPQHWQIKRLKYLGEAIIGLTYSPGDVVDEGAGWLVLRSSNVQGGKITLNDNVYVSCTPPERLLTREGDILICSRNGSRALIGKNAVIHGPSVGMTFGAFMTIFRSPLNDYLSWVFGSSLFETQAGAFMSSTINQLTTSTLNAMEIPVPPDEERTAISKYLAQAVGQHELLIDQAHSAIDLLGERRAALISAAVTGKIDVQQAAIGQEDAA